MDLELTIYATNGSDACDLRVQTGADFGWVIGALYLLMMLSPSLASRSGNRGEIYD
jgi:hypothetical protein